CRQMSLTGTPASACLRIETIWVSVKRDFFMEPPGWGQHARKFYLWGVCGSGKLTQLTGKENYRKYMNYHNNAVPEDKKDFVANPDLVSTELRYGLESAFWYCHANNFSSAADADDLIKTTLIVN